VTVRTLPLIDDVMATGVPDFTSCISIVPSIISSLNVVVICVSTGTFTAPLAGVPAVGWGAAGSHADASPAKTRTINKMVNIIKIFRIAFLLYF
jgi:hypothetical protein